MASRQARAHWVVRVRIAAAAAGARGPRSAVTSSEDSGRAGQQDRDHPAHRRGEQARQ
jgi:hypothetical protein